ncbi:MAG TPA: tetratricopeptide repeat protein [Gemmataceae bacterium]|jgi:tetratricopeptide (TPR) repeat protein/tRNA A-37 threonylcarbamoyl transferase component Bud32
MSAKSLPETPPPCEISVCADAVPPFVASTPLPPRSDGCVTQPALPPARDELPSVPGYQILEELGEGGMGVVYKARHLALKRLVALKMIRAARAGRKARERFRLEAESIARLQHPNIVQIYEVGECDGWPFFSLEYMEGGSLDGRLDGRPLDARQVAELILPLVRAIQYAHDRGIIHRDLKPANILLAMQNERQEASAFRILKVADFGLAKQLDEEVRLSRDGDLLGTPSYMAPEQAGGHGQEVGPRTDVYALGVILYELLTGRAPFLARSAEETLKQVCDQEAVPPRRLVGRLPRDIETICLKCLEKQPARRYGSAAALAEDLRRFLAGEAIQARPIGWGERGVRWARRHPAWATLVGCLLLAGGGAAGAIPVHIHVLKAEVRESKEEIHRLNRENLRERVQTMLRQGRREHARGEWTDARMHFTQILESLGAHADLMDDDLSRGQEQARAELAAVERQLDQLKASEERRRNYQELFRWRDEAFFLLNRDLFTPAATNPVESIKAAEQGLALFGMAEETAGATDFQGYSAAEREELRAGLFELLLIQAEAAARPSLHAAEQRGEQVDRALALLDRADRLAIDPAIVHGRRARYLRQRGRDGEAERERRKAEAAPPRTALGWFLHGQDLGLGESQRTAAIRAFDEALRQRGDLFWAHFLRALAYQKQGEPREAHASLTVCVSRRDGFVWNYLLRGLLRIELGEFQAARADFDKAQALQPDAEARYVLWLNRGTLALKERKADEAIRAFEEAVREKPPMYQAHVNLAEAHAQRNQLSEAVVCLDRAIDLKPGDANLHRTRALLEQRRGRPRVALKDLEEAIRLTPRDRPSLELARYHFERGAVLFLDDQFRAAVQALDEALAVDVPMSPDGRDAERERLRANIYLLRAQTLLKLANYKGARTAFDNYLQHGAATAAVWRQRAAVNLKLEDYKGVLEDCTQALGQEKDAETFCLRGCAYLHFHLPKLALRDFEAALGLHPDYGEALAWRGLARIQTGDSRQGIADARQAVKRSPKSAEVRLQAARVLALAVDADGRAEHRTEALTLLRQAVELIADPEARTAFWLGRVRRDSALSSLMGGADFRDLDQRFGQPRR